MELTEGCLKENLVKESEKKLQETNLQPTTCIKWRYIVAILGSMGMGLIYGLKVNISVAIVAMVNHTALALNAENSSHIENISVTDDHGLDKGTTEEMGPFVWSSKQQGAILSAYFIGYFLTQLPGGRLAELYSAKYVFLVAALMNALGACLSPLMAFWDYKALIAMRVMQGLGGGFTFPAMNVLIASWSPPDERSTISSIAYSGTSLGTVVSILSSGLLSSTLGWESVFYIQGGLSLVWCALWTVLVSDSPADNRFASDIEKKMITESKPISTRSSSSPAPSIPWRSILTSIPFLTLAFSHFCNNFGWYMLLIELPLFMRTGLEVDMTINTIISSVPFFANWMWSVVYSKGLQWARSKDLISLTLARKISVCISSLLPALFLLIICWSGQHIPVIVTLTILSVMFYGSMFSGVFSNHSDLAPNFAGTLMAVTNMLATIPGFLVPFLVGLLTEGQTGLAPWHIVFYITAGILLVEAVVYTLLGSGELQSWN